MNNSALSLGDGADEVNICQYLRGGSIDLGSGDDTLIIGESFKNGTINGGDGVDTLIFESKAFGDSHTGNFEGSIIGIEKIDLTGAKVAIDLTYSDLVNDNTRDGDILYITGDSGSKVDLGDNNWNSDDATQADLKDGGGAVFNKKYWADTGDATVDGITYDIYRNDQSTNGLDDVYIQQGIIVI